MTKTDLLALADKCEVADASEQRELLEAAWRKLRGDEFVTSGVNYFYRFQAMLDAEAYESAALMLLPDMTGKEWSLDYALRDERFGPYQARFNQWAAKDDPEEMSPQWIANGYTPALAITAAALRARAEECE